MKKNLALDVDTNVQKEEKASSLQAQTLSAPSEKGTEKSAKKGVFIVAYGCQMNVYDSQRMEEVLAALGYAPVFSADQADLVILNTCHIREKAEEKVFSELGRLRKKQDAARTKGRHLVLSVAGCVAQAQGEKIAKRAPYVQLVFGPQTYHQLPHMLRALERARQQAFYTHTQDAQHKDAEAKNADLKGESIKQAPSRPLADDMRTIFLSQDARHHNTSVDHGSAASKSTFNTNGERADSQTERDPSQATHNTEKKQGLSADESEKIAQNITLHSALDPLCEGRVRPIVNLEFCSEEKFDFLPQERARPASGSAFLSIQEGCDKFCTYCVVPYTRGAEFSRNASDILREAEALVRSGAREITLLGQNVNAYHGLSPTGRGTWGLGNLMTVLAEKLEPLGLARLRYTTSHPRDMDDALVAAHRDIPLVMPFLHLPVQSGSDDVLKKMNRRHTRDRYFQIIEDIRRARPDIALSSDFIVGFAGETEADFEDTLDLVQHVGFAQAYSFKYSPRPGTPGAARTDQIAEDIKIDRLARLQALLDAQQRDFNAPFSGKSLHVLVERRGRKPGQWIGRSPHMQSVYFQSDQDYLGRLINVTITQAHGKSLEACL